MARLAELWLGSPRDVLTISTDDSLPRRFRGQQLADGDMEENDINENIYVNTTIYILARTVNVTLETDEMRSSKGFRLEFAVSTPSAHYYYVISYWFWYCFELRCTQLLVLTYALSGRFHTRSLVLSVGRAGMSGGAGGDAVREELERRAALPALQAPVCVTFAPRISVYCTQTLARAQCTCQMRFLCVRIAVASIAVQTRLVCPTALIRTSHSYLTVTQLLQCIALHSACLIMNNTSRGAQYEYSYH